MANVGINQYQDLRRAGEQAGLADPDILLGLYHAENGREGFELGYAVHMGDPADIRRDNKDVPLAPSSSGQVKFNKHYGWENQIKGAARQVKLTEERFEQDMGRPPTDNDGQYTDDFMKYFSWGGKSLGVTKPKYNGYAPLRAHDTDPNGKNANHFTNLQKYYLRTKQGR